MTPGHAEPWDWQKQYPVFQPYTKSEHEVGVDNGKYKKYKNKQTTKFHLRLFSAIVFDQIKSLIQLSCFYTVVFLSMV